MQLQLLRERTPKVRSDGAGVSYLKNEHAQKWIYFRRQRGTKGIGKGGC